MNWPLFLSTFTLIFVSELPDKTAFAVILLATREGASRVFCGVALAFLIQSIVAVLFGGLIGRLPEAWVHLGTGLMFFGFAIHTYIQLGKLGPEEKDGSQPNSKSKAFWPSVWRSFLLIFIAEWGDLTQIATASLAAKYHEEIATILISSTLALWLVTAIAILVGQKLQHLIDIEKLKKFTILVFLAFGVYFIKSWLESK